MDRIADVVLFDLDGTLLENGEAVVDAYFTSLQRYGYPPKDKAYIATLAGLSTYETARLLGVREEDRYKIDQHFWEYFHRYADDPDMMPVVFDKVEAMLELLKSEKIPMAVVTSNEARIATKLLTKVNLLKYFDTVVGSEDVTERKPSAQPIKLALERMGLSKETDKEYWFVGDTKSDIGAARNAEFVSIAIPQPHTYKLVIEEEPDYLIDTMKDFYELLLSLKKE
ncbi:MAG: HAD family hydrolase [Candidatus Heimdallarchaeota archaeon]|nr:HAD family hydrolase [Candidatus Heimdallarchaeota archaeon]